MVSGVGPRWREADRENLWVQSAGQVVELWVLADHTQKYREVPRLWRFSVE